MIKTKLGLTRKIMTIGFAMVLTLGIYSHAAAHCDTLDGPVVQDARKAIVAKDVTPVLKWVKQSDEKTVRAAFGKVIGAKGTSAATEENRFFATLIKIHRTGEGASFTGLKPAGSVEPVVAEADRALAGGSADGLVKFVTDAAATGIKERYERAAATFKHKDESVAAGREFVEAYVEYTHYVERLEQTATASAEHGKHHAQAKHSAAGHGAHH